MAPTTTLSEHLQHTHLPLAADPQPNYRRRIVQVHGQASPPVQAAEDLDRYISDPTTVNSCWYWSFYKKVKSAMWALYPHSHDVVRTTMARQYIGDLFNGGYIRALRSLAVPSGANQAAFAAEHAAKHSVSIGAALMFGPRGAAIVELKHFIAAEKTHGMHRNGTMPHPTLSAETRQLWYAANSTAGFAGGSTGADTSPQLPAQRRHLPDNNCDGLRELWRRNCALRNYAGTNRLSGDIPYQIIEDAVDVLVRGRRSMLSETEKARYDAIVQRANQQGVDPFYAAYQQLFADKRRWRAIWNQAREWLHAHALCLWEQRNEQWLAEGTRTAARGVVYKPKRKRARRAKPQGGLPGTIYRNNGGYYWTVAGKLKPRPLIDPESRPQVPGSFIRDGRRYYWYIPGWVKRRRLVPRGQKFSTTDKATALRIARSMWAQIERDDPALAASVRRHTRMHGTATKDCAVAERVAAEMWRDIRRNDPALAARILRDNRRKPRDHWHARIKAGGRLQYIGSFATRSEAEAAYRQRFEVLHGYPPGYNIQCLPKLDKVWPTWNEQRARLEIQDSRPAQPLVAPIHRAASPAVMCSEQSVSTEWRGTLCLSSASPHRESCPR